ncbi:MAG: DUF3231 family protein [Firmicutes bacterium]|nr:DUF3231 family protein [Bacillota bacterium]
MRALEINVQEAYNLWDLVASKYQYIERLELWENFVHDPDLKLQVGRLKKMLSKFVTMLEAKMKQHAINGPDVGKVGIQSSNTDVIQDKLIAQDMFLWVQSAINLFLRAMTTTTTNDELRSTFQMMVENNIDFMDSFTKYLRLKGWIGNPPQYEKIPANEKESIDTGEAFHLWDHLTFRYDNVHQTEVFLNVVKDIDFNVVLVAGQSVLNKQTTRLEKECLRFGIPLPTKPPKVVSFPEDLKIQFTDEFIYRNILGGILGATRFHATALQQTSTNDRIRKLFVDLLLSELNLFDKYIRYGKTKGYLHPVPLYR